MNYGQDNSNRRPRIDSSTPKSFYCSPKSCHYIPFAKRRAQSSDFKRQTVNMSCQNRRCSKASEQSSPCSFARCDTDLFMSSPSLRATFANINQSGRSVLTQSTNDQLQLRDEWLCEKVISTTSKISPEEVSSNCGSNVEEAVDDELDQFKNDILDDIIQRGIYTDSVIQQCVSRNVRENSTLTTANLQRAVSELLNDIGVFNIEMNRMIQTANSEISEECSHFDSEQFESGEGESLPVAASVASGLDKLAKECKYRSSSISTSDSPATSSENAFSDFLKLEFEERTAAEVLDRTISCALSLNDKK
ncbi:unnamed protein product [Litomosoides sigmodontis]|uniref:Uncharacterized protein n=1 Tax=Litomosoides sigmodontis TaxID=42156 RepID=A0A3P6U6M9_LITSI|nr:unnamed protein product [Litomosoides sigmodontis]